MYFLSLQMELSVLGRYLYLNFHLNLPSRIVFLINILVIYLLKKH